MSFVFLSKLRFEVLTAVLTPSRLVHRNLYVLGLAADVLGPSLWQLTSKTRTVCDVTRLLRQTNQFQMEFSTTKRQLRNPLYHSSLQPKKSADRLHMYSNISQLQYATKHSPTADHPLCTSCTTIWVGK